MKPEKEKKYFNRQYIPVIVGISLVLILTAALIFVLFFYKDDDNTKTTTPKFDHQEINVDTSSSTCENKKLKQYVEEANSIDIDYEIVEVDLGPAVDEDGESLGYTAKGEKLKINFKNLTENINIVIKMNNDANEIKLNGKDAKKGVISIDKPSDSFYEKLYVYIYANDDCAKDEIRLFIIEPPSLNLIADTMYCYSESPLKNTKYCEKLVYGKEYDFNEVADMWTEDDYNKFNEVQFEIAKEKMKTKSQRNKEIIVMIAIIIGAVIVLITIIFTLLKLRKKRKIKKMSLSALILMFLFVGMINVNAGECHISANGKTIIYNGVTYNTTCVLAGGDTNFSSTTADCVSLTAKEEAALSWAEKNFSGNQLQLAERLLSIQNIIRGVTVGDAPYGTTALTYILNNAQHMNDSQLKNFLVSELSWGKGRDKGTLEHDFVDSKMGSDVYTLQKKIPKVDDLVKVIKAVKSYKNSGSSKTSAKPEPFDNYLNNSIARFDTEAKIEKVAGTNPTCGGKLVATSVNVEGSSGTIIFSYAGAGTIIGATASCNNCSASAAAAGNEVIVTVSLPAASGGTVLEDEGDVCILKNTKGQCMATVSVKATVTLITTEIGDGYTVPVNPDPSSAPAHLKVITKSGSTQNFVANKAPNSVPSTPTPPDPTNPTPPSFSYETCEVEGSHAIPYECPDSPVTEECGSLSYKEPTGGSHCCTDGESILEENELDDMLCPNKRLKARFYTAKKNADMFADGYANSKLRSEGVSDYCKVYCSEKVIIDQPGPLETSIGLNFRLKNKDYGGGVVTTSAYVQSYKRCRAAIDYHKWVSDYRDAVKEEVEGHNEYQHWYVANQMYGEYKNTIDRSESDVASYSCKKPKKDPITGQNTGEYETKGESFPSEPVDVTRYKYNKEYLFYYVGIINPDQHVHRSAKDYSGIVVEMDKKGHYKHEDCAERYEPNTFSPCEGNEDLRSGTPGKMKYTHVSDTIEKGTRDALNAAFEEANGKMNAAMASASGGGWSCEGDEIPMDSTCAEEMAVITDSLQAAEASAKNKYETSTKKAKDLEEKIEKCDTYFERSDPTAAYQVNTNMEFTYIQTYLDSDMVCKTDPQRGAFEVASEIGKNCTDSVVVVGASGAAGTSGREYSGEYGSGKETMQDLAPGIGFGGLKYDTVKQVDKMFNYDAYYFSKCYKKQEKQEGVTKYPSGLPLVKDYSNGTTSSEVNETDHDGSEYTYSTTFKGKYETYWEITGIAEGGKFDQYAKKGTTCSGKQSSGDVINAALREAKCGDKENASNVELDGPLFTCTFKTNEVLIETGYCNSDGDDFAPFKGCTVDIEGYNFFNFKLVEPTSVFPTCALATNPSSDAAQACYNKIEYGYNWLVEESGQKQLSRIQKDGKDDKTYSPERLTYSVVLTSESISAIRNYNKTVGSYDDFNLTCECPTGLNFTKVEKNDTILATSGCVKCKSKFMESFYGNGKLPKTSENIVKSTGNINTIRNKIWNR